MQWVLAYIHHDCYLVAKSCLTLFATPWTLETVACHSCLSMGFSRQEHLVAISSSRGASQPRDWTQVSWTVGRFCTAKPPGKPHTMIQVVKISILSWKGPCAPWQSLPPGSSLPASPGNPWLAFVNVDWYTFSRVLYKWNHAMYIHLVCLTSFTQTNDFFQ